MSSVTNYINRYDFDPSPAPPTEQVRQLVYCQNCLALFVRALCMCFAHQPASFEHRCGCQKYCALCIQRMLLPPVERAIDDYNDQFPANSRAPRKIRYDSSMLPEEHRRVKTHFVPEPPARRKHRDGKAETETTQ